MTIPPEITELSSDWRKLADLCDAEVRLANNYQPTLIISDYEKIRYKQAAITYRFCANALEYIVKEKS